MPTAAEADAMPNPSGAIRVGGHLLHFGNGVCLAAPHQHLIGRTLADVQAIIESGKPDTPRKSVETKWYKLDGMPHPGTQSKHDTEKGRNKTRSGELWPLSVVARRLRLAKRDLVEAVRMDRVRPDYRTPAGGVLFRPSRLHSIARTLNQKTKRI